MSTVPSPVTAPVANVAAYHFAALDGLKEWRIELLEQCKALDLKGTILLSTEGINLFLAGGREELDQLLTVIRRKAGLEQLHAKFSVSAYQPFRRLLVRIKKEIIAFGVDGIEPARRTAPKLAPRELKRWLDEGRPITLLDTRNDYEVKLGTFRNALTLDLDHFRHFPEAVKRLPERLKSQPLVMFCTGGIRCEKAGAYLEREGYQQVLQLEGGILKYFEECGSAHYDGECFVFDHRVGLDPDLSESTSTMCYACQASLTAEEQQSPKYSIGVSCPYCWKEPAERMAGAIRQREDRLQRAITPLPGAIPYDNYRPLKVPAQCDNYTVADALVTILPHRSLHVWQPLFAAGHWQDAAGRALSPGDRVRAGDRIMQVTPQSVEPEVSRDVRILHEDTAIIVIAKPAPLPMHAGGRYARNTLSNFLALAYAPEKPRPAHRLDANTTGVVVFCRSRRHASVLQPQFQRGEIEKTYLVRVTGHPPDDRYTCDAPISATVGPVGTREIDPEEGLESLTDYEVVARYADGTSLLKAMPRTGRTNQIRLHLKHLGWPVCGDPLYGAPSSNSGQEFAESRTATLAVTDPPLCLHAWQLRFRHPLTRAWLTFTADPPAWAAIR